MTILIIAVFVIGFIIGVYIYQKLKYKGAGYTVCVYGDDNYDYKVQYRNKYGKKWKTIKHPDQKITARYVRAVAIEKKRNLHNEDCVATMTIATK